MKLPESIRVIDSHTGGEPTRVIVANGPELGSDDLVVRKKRFQNEFDFFRSAVINEPRGSDVIVGALPVKPTSSDCTTGVIFFNNVGYIGMCGHGTIGLMVTLLHLGRATIGEQWIETPVGRVKTTIHDANHVTVENVESYRYRKHVQIDVPNYGRISGDIAWGGNWFFLVEQDYIRVAPENLEQLLDLTKQIRKVLEAESITGEQDGMIDHIELFGSGTELGCDSRNFVLCPGGAYDRSPCGTGTSAKLACLAADGKLKPGELWKQASIIGSIFESSYQWAGDGRIIPSIKGSAYICGETVLRLNPNDPFVCGISL